MSEAVPSHYRCRAIFAAALTLATLWLTACSPADDSSPPDTALDDPHLIGHVHSLGTDPGDGTVYAAGHFGLFRIDADGTPTRIADRWQDTMAFTITGPGTFLASGHPDLREDLPPHLGLIESTDAGETWRALSLQGEADFHALDVVGGRVYGYDATSGQLMTTTDRTSWQTIATGQFLDIAVSPSDPARVIATTPSGLRGIELDGTSRKIAAAPHLLWIDATPAGLLVGVTASAELFTTTGPDDEWVAAGRVSGVPAALDATDSVWHVATDEGIFVSSDRGEHWTVVVGPQD